MKERVRHLVLVLGDQLDGRSAVWDGFDNRQDAVWMAEVTEESTHVWSHKARIALFLSAMRHFREVLIQRGCAVHYRQIDEEGNQGTLSGELAAAVRRLRPRKLILVEPGEWRVQEAVRRIVISSAAAMSSRRTREGGSSCAWSFFTGRCGAGLVCSWKGVGRAAANGTTTPRIGAVSAKAGRPSWRSRGRSLPMRSLVTCWCWWRDFSKSIREVWLTLTGR